MDKNTLLELTKENQEKLSQKQLKYNKKLTQLFNESGNLMIELFNLQKEIKEQETLKKDLKDEALQNGILSDLELGEEVKQGDTIFTSRKVKTNKLDMDKVEELEKNNEIETLYTEPSVDEKKMIKLYKNKDIFIEELEVVCYSPALIQIDNQMNEFSNEEMKKLKQENTKFKKIMDDIMSNNINLKNNLEK